jgi:hypothetical protein
MSYELETSGPEQKEQKRTDLGSKSSIYTIYTNSNIMKAIIFFD